MVEFCTVVFFKMMFLALERCFNVTQTNYIYTNRRVGTRYKKASGMMYRGNWIWISTFVRTQTRTLEWTEKKRGMTTFKYQEIVTNTDSFYIWGLVKTNSFWLHEAQIFIKSRHLYCIMHWRTQWDCILQRKCSWLHPTSFPAFLCNSFIHKGNASMGCRTVRCYWSTTPS